MNKKETSIGRNTIWKLLERVCTYSVTFILSILIARILDPSEYGLVAMVTVFITIADVFVTNGFGSAIVQSKKNDNTMFSTVLYTNVIIALVLYAVLFFTAPYIARFYNEPSLTAITRVLSIRVVFGSVKSIQDAYLIKQMAFKKIFIVSFIGSVLSASVGVVLAYSGYGVWTLVIQSILGIVITMLLEIVVSKWKPVLTFRFKEISSLISFGWKLLVGGLIETIGNEIAQLIIGKKYTSEDLAYYNRGQSIPQLISLNVTNSIASVMYPVMTKNQDNKEKLLDITRRSERMTAYIVFPFFFGLFMVSDVLITALLGVKWSNAAIYMRLYCIVQLLITPNYAIQNAVCSIGRSDLKLYMDIIRKVLYMALLVAVISKGVIAIAVVNIITSSVCVALVVYIAKKHIGYSVIGYIKDHMGVLCICALMSAAIWAVGLIHLPVVASLAVKVCTGIAVYILLSYLFKIGEFKYIIGRITALRKKENI